MAPSMPSKVKASEIAAQPIFFQSDYAEPQWLANSLNFRLKPCINIANTPKLAEGIFSDFIFTTRMRNRLRA
jgi:hypothetical protein